MGHRKSVPGTLGLILATERCSALGFMGDSRIVNQKVSLVFRDHLLSLHPAWQGEESRFSQYLQSPSPSQLCTSEMPLTCIM